MDIINKQTNYLNDKGFNIKNTFINEIKSLQILKKSKSCNDIKYEDYIDISKIIKNLNIELKNKLKNHNNKLIFDLKDQINRNIVGGIIYLQMKTNIDKIKQDFINKIDINYKNKTREKKSAIKCMIKNIDNTVISFLEYLDKKIDEYLTNNIEEIKKKKLLEFNIIENIIFKYQDVKLMMKIKFQDNYNIDFKKLSI